MLAPITFPKLNAGVPDNEEEIPTKSSGTEVAKAMIMNAAVNSEILKKWDILLSDFTRRAPLAIKIIQDSTKYKMFSNIFPLFNIEDEGVFIFLEKEIILCV